MFLKPVSYVMPISWEGRALAAILLLLGGIIFGTIMGMSYESDRRDAQILKSTHADEQAFQRALTNGKQHAILTIAWQNQAQIYYQNWQERLKHENDFKLATCQTKPDMSGNTMLLSGTWIGLYNSAWQPDFAAQSDSGRTASEVVEAGTVTPRDALDNIRINAQRCGNDRKRLDELIDHINDIEAQGVNE